MLKEVILLIASVITATNQQCFSTNDFTEFVPHTMLESWVSGQHNFSISLLKIVNKARRGQNVAICPACVYDGLLVAYFGALGKTETALAHFLQIPHNQTKAMTWRFYDNQKVSGIKDANNPYPLILVNKLYFSNKLKVRDCMMDIFSTELETIDYQKDAQKSVSHINTWVEKQTLGQITSVVTKLSPRSPVTVVNAAYFRKKWETAFNPKKTQIMSFYVNNKQKTNIEMMYTRGYFDFAHLNSIRAHVLIVPYRKNRIIMAYLQPDKGLDNMIPLLNGTTLDQVTDYRNFRRVYLDVFVPKIYHRTKLDVVQIIKRNKKNKLFTKYNNFDGFTGKRNVFLNTFVHQSVIDIDEVGTEASQSSYISNARSAGPLKFYLDRPFAYVIYDVMLKKTLFIGTFRKPDTAVESM